MEKHQKFALDFFFVEYPDEYKVFDEVIDAFRSGDNPTAFIVWEPFESYEMEQVAEWVESTADSIHNDFVRGGK